MAKNKYARIFFYCSSAIVRSLCNSNIVKGSKNLNFLARRVISDRPTIMKMQAFLKTQGMADVADQILNSETTLQQTLLP